MEHDRVHGDHLDLLTPKEASVKGILGLGSRCSLSILEVITMCVQGRLWIKIT